MDAHRFSSSIHVALGTLTRRAFAAGAAAAAAMIAGGRRVGPVIAQDGSPVASPIPQPDMTGAVHRFSVGAFACLAVSDGAEISPDNAGLLFAQTPPDELEQALSEEGIDPTRLATQHTAMLVDTGDQLVLVDTGFGPGVPGSGLLLENLQGEGIAPADIDVVILTHGHGDHIGGNLDADGNPTFPNARYVMSMEDWDFWTDEPRVEQAIPVAEFRELLLGYVRRQLVPLGEQIELIGYDEEIVPGITSIAAQGHTPGHMALLVQSDNEQLWIAGDMALHPIDVPHPTFAGLPDVEPDRMLETRERLFARMADEGGLVSFFHFDPFPSLGRVVVEANAWRWEPVPDGTATPAT